MTFQEKSLYHQIHPVKLAVDWGTGLAALYPFWQHNLLVGLLIALVPPPLVSLVLVRFADLEQCKQSVFGHYVRRYMTRPVEAARLAGYAVMALGAWYHRVWLIPAGLLVIGLAWLRGVIFPRRA